MNKAFVKEPEPSEPRCPAPRGCGGLGEPVVDRVARQRMAQSPHQRSFQRVYYCPGPDCPVAYFDAFGELLTAAELNCPAFPKDPEAPLCPCLGITADAIRDEARQGRRDLIRQILQQSEAPDARCDTHTPTGKPCALVARRLFLKHFPSS